MLEYIIIDVLLRNLVITTVGVMAKELWDVIAAELSRADKQNKQDLLPSSTEALLIITQNLEEELALKKEHNERLTEIIVQMQEEVEVLDETINTDLSELG